MVCGVFSVSVAVCVVCVVCGVVYTRLCSTHTALEGRYDSGNFKLIQQPAECSQMKAKVVDKNLGGWHMTRGIPWLFIYLFILLLF